MQTGTRLEPDYNPARKHGVRGSTDIRKSTRRALRDSAEDSTPRELNANVPMSRLLPDVPSGTENKPAAHTSSVSSAGSQIPRPRTAGSNSKSQSTGSLKKTLRRVFSLGSPETIPGLPIRNPSGASNDSGAQKTGSVETLDTSRQSSTSSRPVEAFGGVGNRQAPHINVNALQSMTQDTSRPTPVEPSTRRLRRSKSRILRVDTAANVEPNQPPATSFYSPTTPASAPYLPPSQIMQQLRPTHSSYQNALPPAGEARRSDERTRRSGSNSRRDSLEIQRSRYNISRGSQKEGNTSQSTDGIAMRLRHPAPSSMINERGSLTSPVLTPPPAITQPTAPRHAMEIAGMIARLDDLEGRMAEVEDALRRSPASYCQNPDIEQQQERHDTGLTPPSQLYHTPPSSQHDDRTKNASFLRESSSNPWSDEHSSPSTPIGMTMNSIRALPPAEEPQHSDYPAEIYSSDVRLATEPTVLRASLLDKGYDHTLHEVLHVVNAEHNARVALEANVSSLKKAISALRLEVGKAQRPGTASRGNYVDSRTQFSTRGTGSAGTGSRYSGRTSRRSSDEANTDPPVQTPLGYEDLWSYAAVPRDPSPLSRYTGGDIAEDQEYWVDNAPSRSRFSFDETNSTSGASVHNSHAYF